MVILAAAAFALHSTINMLKNYTPGKLLFGRDTIRPIKKISYYKLIRQKNQAQNSYDNVR